MQLEKPPCTDFLNDARDSKSSWVKDSSTFNVVEENEGLIKLFVNYKASGKWGSKDVDPKVLALATALHAEKHKNAALQSSKGGPPGKKTKKSDDKNRPGGPGGKTPLEQWRFTKEGKYKTVKGVTYEWCPLHGHKDANGNMSGMYMPAPHDHAAWQKARDEKQARWKSGKKSAGKKQPEAKSGGDAKPPSSLALAKSFKAALATHVGLSDAEAEHVMKQVEEEVDGKE